MGRCGGGAEDSIFEQGTGGDLALGWEGDDRWSSRSLSPSLFQMLACGVDVTSWSLLWGEFERSYYPLFSENRLTIFLTGNKPNPASEETGAITG
jgi:hypothetical protein